MSEQDTNPEETGPPADWEDESVWGVPRVWMPKIKKDAKPIAPKERSSKVMKDKPKKRGKKKSDS